MRPPSRQGEEVSACLQCGATMVPGGDQPGQAQWCSQACSDAWYVERPWEAAQWIPVERLTPERRAELDAVLGGGVQC